MNKKTQNKSKRSIGEVVEHHYLDCYGKLVVEHPDGPAPDLYEVGELGEYLGSYPVGTAKKRKGNFEGSKLMAYKNDPLQTTLTQVFPKEDTASPGGKREVESDVHYNKTHHKMPTCMDRLMKRCEDSHNKHAEKEFICHGETKKAVLKEIFDYRLDWW